VDSYNAYQSIRPEYPKAQVVIPEWDVTEAVSEAYPDYLAMIPEEEYWTIQIPAWDITEEGAEAFGQYLSIRPEYPKAAVVIPEWDITDEMAASLEGYRMVEADHFMQAKTVVTSTLSVSKIVIDEVETNIEDKDAIKMGRTGNVAKTGSASSMKLRVKDNTDIDQSNLVINPRKLPARRATASRFVFKDGRLQKVPVKVEVPEVDPAAQNEVSLITEIPEAVTVTEETLEVEPVAPAPEYIALPAAQNYAALPLPKSAKLAAKNIEGVRFSFGKTGSGSGSIRFSF